MIKKKTQSKSDILKIVLENEIFQAFPAGSERVNMSFPWVASTGKNPCFKPPTVDQNMNDFYRTQLTHKVEKRLSQGVLQLLYISCIRLTLKAP